MPQKTIFVIEDNQDIRELIQIVLEGEGYLVKTFSKSDTVEIDISKDKPSLIIMDLWVSGIDNAELTKNLKSKKQTSHIPIIFISAKNFLEKIAKQAKADGFLCKPFNIKDLVKIVKQFV